MSESDASSSSAAQPERHSAVALRYDQKDAAPRVVAKGYGNIADTIIRTAKDNGLYVHESPELVNLLMQVNLDAQIPPQLYVAVAELLAWIYSLENKAGAEMSLGSDHDLLDRGLTPNSANSGEA